MDSEHALSLLALAEDAETGLSGPEAGRWMENLEKRLGDLRGAAAWFLQHGEPQRALRLAAGLTTFWRDGDRLREGREWMESLLNAPGAEVPSAARARVLYGVAMLAFKQGDQETSRARNEEALRIAHAADDWPSQVQALVGLARVALREGDTAAVRDHAVRALTMARDMRDRQAQTRPLHMLAASARVDGNFEEARGLYETSLELNRELGDHSMVATELVNLGMVETNLGDLDSAESRFRAGLKIQRDRDDASLLPEIMIGLAGVAAARGDLARTVRLLASGQARLEASGAVLDPDDQPEFDRMIALARRGLDTRSFEAAWNAGLAMGEEEVVAFALGWRVDRPE